jgi:MraZ protein
MIPVQGEFEVTLDPKGRFLLPAKLISQLPQGVATHFVINRGFDDCLYLHPMENWMKKSQEIQALPDYEDDNRKLKKFFNYGMTMVDLDSASRILLPQSSRDYAGLEKDVVLSGQTTHIEIWDKSKYHQFFDSFTPANYRALYKKVNTQKTDQ